MKETTENENQEMSQEFVPYELAVKLKELGFDKPCFGYCKHVKQFL